MKLLGLSATIPNIKQFAAWIESIHDKTIKVIIEKERPVPLRFLFQCQNEITDKIDHLRRIRSNKPNRLNTLIDYLRNNDGLPAIYFVFSRRRAEELAQELYGIKFLYTK